VRGEQRVWRGLATTGDHKNQKKKKEETPTPCLVQKQEGRSNRQRGNQRHQTALKGEKLPFQLFKEERYKKVGRVISHGAPERVDVEKGREKISCSANPPQLSRGTTQTEQDKKKNYANKESSNKGKIRNNRSPEHVVSASRSPVP